MVYFIDENGNKVQPKQEEVRHEILEDVIVSPDSGVEGFETPSNGQWKKWALVVLVLLAIAFVAWKTFSGKSKHAAVIDSLNKDYGTDFAMGSTDAVSVGESDSDLGF